MNMKNPHDETPLLGLDRTTGHVLYGGSLHRLRSIYTVVLVSRPRRPSFFIRVADTP